MSIFKFWLLAATTHAVMAMMEGGKRSAASVFSALERNSMAWGRSASLSTWGHRVRRSMRKPSSGRYGLWMVRWYFMAWITGNSRAENRVDFCIISYKLGCFRFEGFCVP